MANNIGEWIPKLASEWNTKFEKLDDGITWAIDVPFSTKDGKSRFQWVYISYGVGVAKGRDIYDIRSKVGDYSSSVDLHGMMVEAKFGFYSIVCIKEVKREEHPTEVIFVQAGPIADHVSTYEQFQFIIQEVGDSADILEDKFFKGVDKA
jgi:hypothetical protein